MKCVKFVSQTLSHIFTTLCLLDTFANIYGRDEQRNIEAIQMAAIETVSFKATENALYLFLC